MCRTAIISDTIVRLGTRSFRQRLEAASGMKYKLAQLASLNRDIETLCELLHTDYNSITEADYSIFGPQLDMMIESIGELITICSRMPESYRFGNETERLAMNKSGLSEIKYDIENYRLSSETRQRFSPLLSSVSRAIASLSAI